MKICTKTILTFFVPSDLDLWPLELKFVSLITLVQCHVPIKLDFSMTFVFRKNWIHRTVGRTVGWTDRRTDEQNLMQHLPRPIERSHFLSRSNIEKTNGMWGMWQTDRQTDKYHKNKTFSLVKCIWRYVWNVPLLNLILVWRMPFPIADPLQRNVYLQPFSRYWALSVLGTRVWFFMVTWRHRSRDHLTRHGQFPIGGPLEQ